mmetsp:Transcript_6449/g.16753  ORF Transcript_6449/g.16753 Transcript_6449/m.16753 type:complete len:226 (+) Transcript_6449:816-1493(+)
MAGLSKKVPYSSRDLLDSVTLPNSVKIWAHLSTEFTTFTSSGMSHTAAFIWLAKTTPKTNNRMRRSTTVNSMETRAAVMPFTSVNSCGTARNTFVSRSSRRTRSTERLLPRSGGSSLLLTSSTIGSATFSSSMSNTSSPSNTNHRSRRQYFAFLNAMNLMDISKEKKIVNVYSLMKNCGSAFVITLASLWSTSMATNTALNTTMIMETMKKAGVCATFEQNPLSL